MDLLRRPGAIEHNCYKRQFAVKYQGGEFGAYPLNSMFFV